MLYLEDYLEVIENIPQEIKDKTSELQELDLKIQKSSDHVEDQIKTFFGNAKKMKLPEKTASFEKLKKDYYKLLNDADEKVSIASTMHDSLERYVRKLDQELEKFKCELEADSPGITEILEKKSLELDEPIRDSQKENRFGISRNTTSLLSTSDWNHLGIKKEDSDPNLSSSLSLSPPPSSSLSYTLGHIGAGSNVIAAAASQAIAATQQLRHGRKTASLVASYDAVSQGILPSDLSIGSELAHAAKAALAASSLNSDSHSGASSLASVTSTSSAQKRQKKSQRVATMRELSPAPSEDIPPESMIDPIVDNPDWTYDPNEPRYCVCNQVSYGNMVACDNPKCPLEWFHYQCVGMTAPPKGKWYCPQCAASMNRRQRK